MICQSNQHRVARENIGNFSLLRASLYHGLVITLLKQAMRLHPYYHRWYLRRLGICYRMIGRYEEPATALEGYLNRGKDRNNSRDYLYLATTYSMMGRGGETRANVAKALELNPKMSIESWRKRFLYKDSEDTERIIMAPRKAGFPEK